MSSFTHIPYGLSDSSKRKIINPGFRDELEFVKYSIETGGDHFLIQILVQPDGGVPLHQHSTYSETFFPFEGDLGVIGHNGTKTLILSKERGDTYTVKPREWHRFFNPSKTETVVFDAKIAPAYVRFEKMLNIFYGLATDGLSTPEGLPKSMFHMLMLMDMADMSQPGLSGWLMSWAGKIAGLVARWTGEEERLVQKYYGRPITEEDRKKWKVA